MTNLNVYVKGVFLSINKFMYTLNNYTDSISKPIVCVNAHTYAFPSSSRQLNLEKPDTYIPLRWPATHTHTPSGRWSGPINNACYKLSMPAVINMDAKVTTHAHGLLQETAVDVTARYLWNIKMLLSNEVGLHRIW